MKFFGLLILPMLVLTSCGPAVTSIPVARLQAIDKRTARAQGEVYYLPRSLLRVHLYASPATGLSIALDNPVVVPADGTRFIDVPPGSPPCPDDAGRDAVMAGPYLLSHRRSGFHKDTMEMSVSNSMLTKISSDTEEEVTTALANLAKSAGSAMGLEGAVENDQEPLFEATFDPADCAELAAVNAGLQEAVARRGIPRLARFQAAAPADGAIRQLKLDTVDANGFSLRLVGYKPFRFPASVAATPADCRVGVCVPVPRPAIIAITANGETAQSPLLNLTNGSDPVAIPVSRSGFADVKTVLTFQSGVLTKREIVRGSEVAAVALLPATIVGAYLDSIATVFTKRKTASDNRAAFEKAVADAKIAKLENSIERGEPPLVELFVPGLSLPRGASTSGPLVNDTLPPMERRPGVSSGSDGTLADGPRR